MLSLLVFACLVFQVSPYLVENTITVENVDNFYYPSSFIGEQTLLQFVILMNNCPFEVEVIGTGFKPTDEITIKDDVTDPKNWVKSQGQTDFDLKMTVQPKKGYVIISTSPGSRDGMVSVDINQKCDAGNPNQPATKNPVTRSPLELTTKGSGTLKFAILPVFAVLRRLY